MVLLGSAPLENTPRHGVPNREPLSQPTFDVASQDVSMAMDKHTYGYEKKKTQKL